MLTARQELPAGIQTGSYGPDLKFRVRYEEDGSLMELFFLQYQQPCLAPILEASLSPGSCFFDVGANIGIYSSWASRMVGESGQVHAFEPIPSTRSFLWDLLGRNAIENVHVEPVAVGNDTGLLRIYLPERASGIASAVHKRGEPFDVEVTTLDRYIADSGCPIPSLIKIDVEDFEHQVLLGASKLLSRKDAPVVVFETRGNDAEAGTSDFARSAALFHENGYEIFGLCRSGLRRITDVGRGPISLNTLAARPDEHEPILAKLRKVRFRRNQNC